MTKSEIIESVLTELKTWDDAEYEEKAVSYLQTLLHQEEPSTRIRTCSDFSHLNVKCCDTCHHFSLPFEMHLADLEGGGNAWICCAMRRVLNPLEHAIWEQSTEWKDISEILGGGQAKGES